MSPSRDKRDSWFSRRHGSYISISTKQLRHPGAQYARMTLESYNIAGVLGFNEKEKKPKYWGERGIAGEQDYKCFCKTVKSRVRTATYQANIYAHKTGRFSAINQGTLICSIIYNAFLIDLQLPKADLNRPHCQYQGTLKIDALLRHYTALLRYSNDNSVRYSPFVYLVSPFSMSAATQSTKSTTSIQTIIATYSPRQPHWRPCSLHAAALVNEAGLQEDDRHIPIVALSRQSRAA
ncbi:hypothetical protein CAPTEDRAFT_185831 [Capitella teleta]|uniref:Uncharacterized protein n=1 Tax=Capitella teleta TaxID=283909 RepID=R7TCK9_CAPTE|nr:hypothetical protein CAPTEDRAFT_185831 [Capitella teleta]|eukprot:ELT91454.1 hypothetical protein CAPTEDRAFT_185831 [Capitella teleta]